MEIEGPTVQPVAPSPSSTSVFQSESSGDATQSSFPDAMDATNISADAGSTIISNESSVQSSATEPQPAPVEVSLQPSTSILSHMPPVSNAAEVPQANGSLAAASASLAVGVSPASSTTSLTASNMLSTSMGGAMLSTGIGKKIKILAKKPEPVPEPTVVSPVPVVPEIADMGAHSYHMDVDSGYDTSMMSGYSYDSVLGVSEVSSGVGSARKRKTTPYSEYDLTSSSEVPPAKKRAGGKLSGASSRASYASASPSSSSASGLSSSSNKLRNSGAIGGMGGGGAGMMSTPRSEGRGGISKVRGSPASGVAYYPPASGRRMPPPGSVNSRRELEGTPMAVCYDAVVDLMDRPEAGPFNQPVDVVALGIPTYYQIISHPMDLRTIKDKVKRITYANAHEFVSDVRLVWSNAITFNTADSPVHHYALSLSHYFESQVPRIVAQASALDPHSLYEAAVIEANANAMNQQQPMGHLRDTPASTPSRYSPGPSYASSSSSPSTQKQQQQSAAARSATPKAAAVSGRPQRAAAQQLDPKRIALEERLKTITASIKTAETQLTNLKKNGYNQALNRAIDALAQRPPPRSFEVSDVSTLPYPLRASLAHVLRTMTDVTHVREVVKIMMQESFPFPRHGTEIGLSVDDMEPILLRRIEHYIRTQYPDGATLLDTPAPEEPEHIETAGGAPSSSAVGNNGNVRRSSSNNNNIAGPTAGTSASSTDEDMLVDVLGVEPSSASKQVPSTAKPSSSSATDASGVTGASSTRPAAKPSVTSSSAAAAASSSSKHVQKSSHHLLLDESDSDTSDTDDEDDVVSANLLARSSTRVLDIVVPTSSSAASSLNTQMEIKNVSWSNLDTGGAGGKSPATARPMTPGSTTSTTVTTPGGFGTASSSSSSSSSSTASAGAGPTAPTGDGGASVLEGGDGASSAAWASFRTLDAQNKQRDKERAELEEKQKREREEREKAEEERRKKAAEEAAAAAQRAAEEEKAKREAEIKARREAEKAQREASAAEAQGIDMMEQSSIMRTLEKQLQ